MKRADLKAEVVYGYYQGRPSCYSEYQPIVLLDTETWRVQHGPGSSVRITKAPGERLRSARRHMASSYGMPGIILRNARNAARATTLGSTGNFKWYDEITDPEKEEILGTYALVTNSRHLHGLYEPLREAKELAYQQRKEAAAARAQYAAEQDKKLCVLHARLDALGIPAEASALQGGYGIPTRVSLSFEQFDQLLILAETES